MKKGPVIAVLIVGSVLLFLMPPIHAAIREANLLFAMAIAQRESDQPYSSRAWFTETIEGFAPIPSAMHWVGIGAGTVCLIAGLALAWRAWDRNAAD